MFIPAVVSDAIYHVLLFSRTRLPCFYVLLASSSSWTDSTPSCQAAPPDTTKSMPACFHGNGKRTNACDTYTFSDVDLDHF